MLRGGFPAEADMLTPEEWEAIAVIRDERASKDKEEELAILWHLRS
jgi:hypothetical protein